MTETYATTLLDAAETAPAALEVRVPASTSNLGSGFDCFGLALQLYLTVRAARADEARERCTVRSTGEGSATLAGTAADKNLIFRAMQLAAERAGWQLPPVQLEVHNEIPLGSGLGSSAAAIIAGLSLCGRLCGAQEDLDEKTILQIGIELEGHPDNVAASLLGGWVTSAVKVDKTVLSLKRHWPPDIKLVIVTPDAMLNTHQSRAALPPMVSRADAVHNLQRAALFGAALDARRDDFIWEAMQDRLHQAHRQFSVPGLAEALAVAPMPGLLGVAMSGAGPSVIALARENFAAIGARLAENFAAHSLNPVVRVLDVDTNGRVLKEI